MNLRHLYSQRNKEMVLLKCEEITKSFKNFYSKFKYTPQVEACINRQIQAEQQASQDYLSMAVYFLHPCVARPGAGGFFMKMYEEELRHMQDFIQYQLLRGGTTVIQGLKPPDIKPNLTLSEAFQKGLEMEKNITAILENLVMTAESCRDYQCADFVTSVFLADQMRSINEMSNHVTKLARLSDSEHGQYHYDLKLAKAYPWSYNKPKEMLNHSG